MSQPGPQDQSRFGRTLIEEVVPDVDLKVRRLCTKPYKGHKRGCPNWNQRATCPPKAPPITKVWDLDDPCYAVVVPFNLLLHRLQMRLKHPGWTEGRLMNSRYWQGSVRKVLKVGIRRLLEEHPHLLVLECPEACGVLVTSTVAAMATVEWPPKGWDHHIAIGGRPLAGVREAFPDFAAGDNVHWGGET